ncbi:YdeI/OmpD-associated family protein [Kibdelosporangium aridum]|uniref:YdeI/OmpD-associated family protein n=1 Tax=Kibdelosporangium aridum TaxID=2030 RepID=UPI00052407EF
MKFRAELEATGKNTTGIPVPDEVVAALGTSKKPPVVVTINGYTYRNTVARMGGRYLLSVSADNRSKAGVSAGDELEVTLELDTEPRVVTVPDDFAAELDKETAARQAFDKLSYSHQLRWVLSVEDAKTAETRQRRITKAVESLKSGK